MTDTAEPTVAAATMSRVHHVATEVDYVSADDVLAPYVRVINAVTQKPFESVIEANAVDGWLYQHRNHEDGDLKGQPIMERFIDDSGRAQKRPVKFRVEAPVAILFNDMAPASMKSQQTNRFA